MDVVGTAQYIEVLLAEHGSYRGIAKAVGLRHDKDAPLLWKVHKGHAVRASTLKRIRRALGLEPPPRKLFRPVCSKEEWEQFQRWKAGR